MPTKNVSLLFGVLTSLLGPSSVIPRVMARFEPGINSKVNFNLKNQFAVTYFLADNLIFRQSNDQLKWT